MRNPILLALSLALPTIAAWAGPAPSPDASPNVSIADTLGGQNIDEGYRNEFGRCDTEGAFRGHALPGGHGCSDDPNRVTALRRLGNGSILFVSKLAVDLDGSPFACGPDHGRSDQCPTSLMLPQAGSEVPVDSDAIPYVVIPEAGPSDVRGEFGRRTGVQVGDFGVVIANGRTVPVIVADTGPFGKLGEGSLALHRALGRELCAERDSDGVCRRVVEPMESIEGNVTTILYPGTARHDLTPATIGAVVRREGLRLWAHAQAQANTKTGAVRS